jgi:site-specific DNA recombinase
MARDKKRIEAILKHVFAGGGTPLIGVSYERVSHRKSVDGTSLETQPEDILKWAGNHSIRVLKHYVDRGRSGRSANRAAYQQMLTELAELKVQVVLVWKLDRFARNMLLQLQKIEEFNALGVALVSITEMIDYTTAMGKQQMALASMFAQAHSDQLSERMERALRHTAQQGYWVGPAPLGYARQGRRQPLMPTEDAAIVREIFARYATGTYSDTQLTSWLNGEGYTGIDWRSGERIPFTREGVRHILRNRAYIGKVTSGGAEFQGNHPPLIDQDTWDQCQRLRGRRTTENVQVHRRDDGLLQGLAFCAVCHAPLWQHRSGGYRYYRCSSIRDARCDALMSRIEAIDHLMLDLLSSLYITDTLLERTQAVIGSDLPRPSQPLRDYAALEAQRERLNKLYVLGRISDVDYEAQYAALAAPADEPAVPAQVDLNRALDVIGDLPRLMREATPIERKQVINLMFDRVWVGGKTIAAITPNQVYLTLLTAMRTASCVIGVADGTLGQSQHTPRYALLPQWLALRVPRPSAFAR